MQASNTESVKPPADEDLPRDPRLRNRKQPAPLPPSPLPTASISATSLPQPQPVTKPTESCSQFPLPPPQYPGAFAPGQNVPYFYYPPTYNQSYPFPRMDVPPPPIPSIFTQPPPNFNWPVQQEPKPQTPQQRPRSESENSRQSEDSRSSRDKRRRSRTPERRRRGESRDRGRRYRERSRDRRSRSRERHRSSRSSSSNSKRDVMIEKWRRLNCTSENEFEKKMLRLSKMNSDQLLKEEANYWIRSAPATTFYDQDKTLV